ncbi:hypothetical protein EBZ80_04935 [bacterium]|nr:hypothetical protein [bacterium]
MDEFRERCDISLNGFVKKSKNRAVISRFLWKQAGRDPVYADFLCFEFLSELMCSMELKEVVRNLTEGRVGWQHPAFEGMRRAIRQHDEFLINPPEIQEGVIECRCGSRRTFSFSKQTRRADESATVFVRCSACGKTFRM